MRLRLRMGIWVGCVVAALGGSAQGHTFEPADPFSSGLALHAEGGFSDWDPYAAHALAFSDLLGAGKLPGDGLDRTNESAISPGRVDDGENLSVLKVDLHPVPEPAAVLMVTLAGMLTIFRRRSRPV